MRRRGTTVVTNDEREMTFAGFLLFTDPPKEGAAAAVADLRSLGIRVKIITGDNALVACRMAGQLGRQNPEVLTGAAMREMSDAALMSRAGQADIFAEIEPNQKERIITALPDLGVLAQGGANGRVTFANTMKHIFITTNANFGNMLSMAGASLFLPFLPLLPKQILLNNFLSGLPSLAIATDDVDTEQLETPRRWDQGLIRRFMFAFGMVSSVFDFLTCGLLLLWLRSTEAQFQTAWFVESLMTELFIVMVTRTHRPFLRSRPGGCSWRPRVPVVLSQDSPRKHAQDIHARARRAPARPAPARPSRLQAPAPARHESCACAAHARHAASRWSPRQEAGGHPSRRDCH